MPGRTCLCGPHFGSLDRAIRMGVTNCGASGRGSLRATFFPLRRHAIHHAALEEAKLSTEPLATDAPRTKFWLNEHLRWLYSLFTQHTRAWLALINLISPAPSGLKPTVSANITRANHASQISTGAIRRHPLSRSDLISPWSFIATYQFFTRRPYHLRALVD